MWIWTSPSACWPVWSNPIKSYDILKSLPILLNIKPHSHRISPACYIHPSSLHCRLLHVHWCWWHPLHQQSRHVSWRTVVSWWLGGVTRELDIMVSLSQDLPPNPKPSITNSTPNCSLLPRLSCHPQKIIFRDICTFHTYCSKMSV